MWPACSSFSTTRATRPGVGSAFSENQTVEMDAELFEVVAAVGQLFVQRMRVNVRPVLAEQRLGVGDQRVEVQLALLVLGFVVGAGRIQAGRGSSQYFGGLAYIFVAMRQLQLRAMPRT